MLTKTKFLEILNKILSNGNLVKKEKEHLESIKKTANLLPEEILVDLLIEKLGLITIKGVTDEDGYFKEFVNTIDNNEQESQTEIFYLLKGKQVSCLHTLDTTETWNWHGGKEIYIFIFKKDQKPEKITLNETNPIYTIEKNTLFGAKIATLRDNSDYALVTCLCKPGFLREHYTNPTKNEIGILYKKYPGFKKIIEELTPKMPNTSKNIFQSIFQLFTCCIGVKKNQDEINEPLINSSLNNP